VQPATAWLDIMAERELLTTTTQEVAPAQTPPLIVLPEAAFREAVRQALHDFHRLEALRTNLLMRSRIVAGSGDIPADPAALREIVGEAVADLAANPKQERSHQALWHTCIVPAPSQEAAADVLGYSDPDELRGRSMVEHVPIFGSALRLTSGFGNRHRVSSSGRSFARSWRPGPVAQALGMLSPTAHAG